MERRFNFKLLVPPRVNNGQVSAVRPQEIMDNGDVLTNTSQQSYSKGGEEEQSMLLPVMSVVAPSKPTQPDFPKVKVVPPMENGEINSNPGQLCSKLFDEVEKIKCWKVQVDSDNVQNERRLQENKRTIETQRKAILELQFGNESLSVKLEEQISENEALRSKNITTRNLLNFLKDTFQRSNEKMQLFQSEREETHSLFVENNESVKKIIAAFESLRIRAESDQQELQKVKEALLQFEDLKGKYHQEYNMKEKEVSELQTKMKENEKEQEKLQLELHETQKHSELLQESMNEQYELLKSSKAEQDSLLEKLQAAEEHCRETEKNCKAIAALLEQNKEEHGEIIQNKDLILQELHRVNDQQAQKLEDVQTTVAELQNSLALETQRTKELENKCVANDKELEKKDTLLGENIEQSAKKDRQIQVLQDELDKKSESIEFMKAEIEAVKMNVEELAAELSRKTEEAHSFKNETEIVRAENDLLKAACKRAEDAQEDLKHESTVAEIRVHELEGQLFTQTAQMDQLNEDFTRHQAKYKDLLSSFNELQSEKTAVQQQLESGSSSVKAIEAKMKEKAAKFTREVHKLEKENQSLREEVNAAKAKILETRQETETLQKNIEETLEQLQEKTTETDNQNKSMEKKNKMLKKQIANENAKSSQLETEIISLREEVQNLQTLNKDHQKLLEDLESKTTFAAELENEVQKLKTMAAEATKNKEDTELKCQHKIADMVTLMEKHKSQYDQMVKQKDAELDESKKKETEAAALRKSLELDLTKHKANNNQLMQQLKTEVRKKESTRKELTDLKKEMSSIKVTQLSEAKNNQGPASRPKQGIRSGTPKDSYLKRHIFDVSQSKKTPSFSKEDGSSAALRKTSVTESIKTSRATTPKTKDFHNDDLKTPKSATNRVTGASKIKSYRIRTPPSTEKKPSWGTSKLVFDTKSDSSDQNDLFTLTHVPTPRHKASLPTKSPPSKSVRNPLKIAAIKRMRDAGWSAVMGYDKKQKMNNEKIFA